MVAGWLFPDRERCGIAIYSRNYISALRKHCTIKSVNSDCWLDTPEQFSDELNSCDLIHIQYETSFFLKQNRDFYGNILNRLKKPVIVSLHEVYEQFPGIFPRDQISGGIIISSLKKFYYDFRHPLQTAYRKHAATGFGATALLVHHHNQKEILQKQIDRHFQITIMPMPVFNSKKISVTADRQDKCITLGATGFINPEYDYSLLFETLENLRSDWQFLWIGGIRIPEHQPLLDTIYHEINLRKWSGKFTITGWVSDETQDTLLDKLDFYLALFKNRSSSASLARAIGAHRQIIATDCQIVREMNSAINREVITVVKGDGHIIAEQITSHFTDKKTLTGQSRVIDEFIARFNFDSMALMMTDLYKSIAQEGTTYYFNQ